MTRGYLTFEKNADGETEVTAHTLPKGAVWVGSFGGQGFGIDTNGRVWWMKGEKWLSIVEGNEPLVDALRYVAKLEGFVK